MTLEHLKEDNKCFMDLDYNINSNLSPFLLNVIIKPSIISLMTILNHPKCTIKISSKIITSLIKHINPHKNSQHKPIIMVIKSTIQLPIQFKLITKIRMSLECSPNMDHDKILKTNKLRRTNSILNNFLYFYNQFFIDKKYFIFINNIQS